MPEEKHKLSNIRNIGIVAHIDAGKTTTTESILYLTIWGVIGSIALAPATGGASLLLGAASVGAAGAVVATTLNVADGYAEINNGKGSTIKLTNEMNESNDKLGEKDNWLSEQIKANIEVPPKDYCKIM